MGVIYLDAISAVILGLMIAYIAYKLSMPCIKELLDSAIEPGMSKHLKTQILSLDEVIDIHDFRTRRHGRRVIIDLHIQVSPRLTVSEGHMVALSVEKLAKNTFNEAVDIVVHIDPENDKYENQYERVLIRPQIINDFKKYLVDQSCFDEPIDIRLHYLGGKVELDVYFSKNCQETQKQQQIKDEAIGFIQKNSFCTQINFYNKW